MRVDWTEQVFRIHELEPGADAATRGHDELTTRRGTTVAAGGDRGRRARRHALGPRAAVRHRQGNARWVRAQGVAICEDGRPVRLLGAFQDITEKKTNALELHRLNEELTRLSTTDALTEVGNRRLFDQTLQHRVGARGAPRRLDRPADDRRRPLQGIQRPLRPPGRRRGAAPDRAHGRRVGAARRRARRALRRRGVRAAPAGRRPRGRARRRRALPPAGRSTPRSSTARRRRRPGSASASASPARSRSPAVDCGVLVEIADAALYRAKRCGRGRIEF